MEIKVQDNIVCFEYILKSDTPEFVSKECCRDFKFDQKCYEQIKERISTILEVYKQARRKYMQEKKKQPEV